MADRTCIEKLTLRAGFLFDQLPDHIKEDLRADWEGASPLNDSQAPMRIDQLLSDLLPDDHSARLPDPGTIEGGDERSRATR